MRTVTLQLLPEPRVGRNLAPLLRRSAFEVHPVDHGRTALVLARHLAYDLLVVGFPVPDLPLPTLLEGIRRSDSSSARTPLLVLAEPDQMERLRRRVPPRPLLAHASADDSTDHLQQRVAALLGVARRARSRLLVRLCAGDGDSGARRICQTHDISESGILLRTSRLLPVGTRVALELDLPDSPMPLTAEAEVVRHAGPDAGQPKGMAVRFVQLGGDRSERLRNYVERAGGGA